MTLYEIDEQIRQIIEQGFTVDEETGEVISDLTALEELQAQREQKIENTLLYIKNVNAEMTAIRNEEKLLTQRRKTLENKSNRLKEYIKFILDGENFNTPKVQVRFRHTPVVSLDNDFITWAMQNNSDLLRYKEPEADKTAIGKLLKAGENIPHATLEQSLSMTIK